MKGLLSQLEIIKKFFFLLFLSLTFVVSLPAQKQVSDFEKRCANMVKRIDAKVQLTDKQESELMANYMKDWMPMLKEYQTLQDNLEKEAMMNKINAKRDEILNASLTEEQKIIINQ